LSPARGEVHRTPSKPVQARSKPLGALKTRQLPIERPQWQVSCLARNLEHEAIGKSEGWSCAEGIEGTPDHVRFL
jgi:hypothetical protein